MRPQIIDDIELLELIDVKKLNQAEAARELGVTRQAISRRLQDIKSRNTRVVVAKESKEILKKGFDAISQLTEINKRTIDLLDEAEKDPQFALKCISEIRNQVRLAMEVQERIYNQQEAENFMVLVIDTLKEVSPDAFKKFKERINEHKSFRNILKFT